MTNTNNLSKQSKRYIAFGVCAFIFTLVTLDYVYYGKVTCGALKSIGIQTWHANGGSYANSTDRTNNDSYSVMTKDHRVVYNHKLSYDDYWKSDFNIQASDVIVFLHIQKTGGTTFGKHLVRHLQLDQPCRCKKSRKRCRCYRPNSQTKWWLFSRYSTGWGCGLHADWTELTSCVDGELDKMEGEHTKRRYFYITILRNPVARYLSEFKHVQRGATWKTTKYWCGGREATHEEVPPCYHDIDWAGVSLEEFMDCESNMATNRQTRMLADLSLVSCYKKTGMSKRKRDIIILASAKENLRKMAYFGLCEYQQISQYMFEKTFNLHFNTAFVQFNETHVSQSIADGQISQEELARVNELNYLDIQLYEYAKDLLLSRHQLMRAEDPDYAQNFNNLGDINKINHQSKE